MKQTENLNLNKPEKTDSFNIDHFNENADILDESVGGLQTDMEEVKNILEDGVGDYTAPTIASSPTIAVVPDTSSVPISSSSGILNRITWSNFKNILKSYFDTLYPPKSHSTTATTYGVGTQTAYGHTKVIDNLTTTGAASGMALSARQGNALKGLIDDIQEEIDSSTADNTKDAINSSPEVTTIGPADKIVKITAANGGLEHITFSQLEAILKTEIRNVTGGNDAEKSQTPEQGQVYLAYDTEKIYVCNTPGTWKLANPITKDQEGILYYGGEKIQSLGSSQIEKFSAQASSTSKRLDFNVNDLPRGVPLGLQFYAGVNTSVGVVTCNLYVNGELVDSGDMVSYTNPTKMYTSKKIYLEEAPTSAYVTCNQTGASVMSGGAISGEIIGYLRVP